MKLRKKIAALLAATLVMTLFPTTVFAADVTSLSDNSVSGNVSGNVNYVDTVKYIVTLPTTANLDFALDPQGLSTISDGQTVSEGALANSEGKIVSTKQTYVKNASSVPIKLSAKFYITDGAGAAPTDVSIVSQNTSVSNNTRSLYLEILTGTAEGVSANNYVSTNFVSANSGAPITATTAASATEVLYQLDKADYAFHNDGTVSAPVYEYVLDTNVSDNYDCTYFTVSGSVAKDADWSAYAGDTKTKSLKLNAVFTFTPLNSFVSAANSGTAYRLVTTASSLDETASGSTTQSKTSSGAAVTYNITSPVTSVTVQKSTATSPAAVTSTRYSQTASTITFTTDWVTALKTAAAPTYGTGTYTITMNHASGSTVVTLIVN